MDDSQNAANVEIVGFSVNRIPKEDGVVQILVEARHTGERKAIVQAVVKFSCRLRDSNETTAFTYSVSMSIPPGKNTTVEIDQPRLTGSQISSVGSAEITELFSRFVSPEEWAAEVKLRQDMIESLGGKSLKRREMDLVTVSGEPIDTGQSTILSFSSDLSSAEFVMHSAGTSSYLVYRGKITSFNAKKRTFHIDLFESSSEGINYSRKRPADALVPHAHTCDVRIVDSNQIEVSGGRFEGKYTIN